jgi:dolichol-phosphate mannosyltransferase
MNKGKMVTCSDRPMLSIIVPTLREAVNIGVLVKEISKAIDSIIPCWELIIVDDDSGDGIIEVCDKLHKNGEPVKLVVRKNEKGLATAVLRGFCQACAPVFIVMDADLSHPPAAIPVFYKKILDGADFVIGSRYIPGGGTDDKWTLFRFINSKIATWLAKPLVSVTDPMSGFFAIPREFLESCNNLSPVGYKIGLELIVKGNPINLKEVPIYFRTRVRGKSKLSIRQQFLYLCHLRRLYAHKWRKT